MISECILAPLKIYKKIVKRDRNSLKISTASQANFA